MQISVVIPTYRRPQLLMNCLKALLNQKFDKGEFEIIVVTDGPDAESHGLVRRLSRQRLTPVRCLALPDKRGPAAARNLGWLNARAPVIAFTDDDCLPDPRWLQAIAAHIDPLAPEALTGRIIVPRRKRPTDFELNTAGLEKAEFVTANCVCTKLALIRTGGFDEQFAMAWREDSDLEFKLLQEGIAIRHVDEAIVVHPVRKARWGVSILEQKKTLYNALLYKKFPFLYRAKIQPSPPVLYYAIIVAFITMLAGICSATAWLGIAGFYLWIFLTFNFIVRRLYATELSAVHVAEMVVTSFCIPFVSVYWQLYGAVKYRVLFV